MARLPQVARENPLTPFTPSSVSASDIARPYEIIAEAIRGVGKVIQDKGEQYEHATGLVTVARTLNGASKARQQLSAQSKGNAGAFEASWEAFTEQTVAKLPRSIRDEVKARLIGMGGQEYDSIVDARYDQDVKIFKSELLAEADRRGDELMAMAYDGRGASQEFADAVASYRGLSLQMAKNPVFGSSEKLAGYDLDRLHAALAVEAVRGTIDRDYADDPVTARRLAEGVISDPEFPFSPEEREARIKYALSGFEVRTATDRNETAISLAARESIKKDGYDLIDRGQMNDQWLDAHRDDLDKPTLKAFTRALDPLAEPVRTDPAEYLDLLDMVETDPIEAVDQAKSAYADGRITKTVFDRIYGRAGKLKAEGVSRAKEVRSFVDRSLRPSKGASREEMADHLDTMEVFDDWLSGNPEATREETRRFADDLVKNRKTFVVAKKRQTLPFPRFAWGAAPETFTPDEMIRAKQRTAAALRLGWINEDQAREEAMKLMQWDGLLKEIPGG